MSKSTKATKATSSTKVTSEVLNAGEKGVDRAIKKIMRRVPGSSGPPKALVDALAPAIRYLGRKNRGESTAKPKANVPKKKPVPKGKK